MKMATLIENGHAISTLRAIAAFLMFINLITTFISLIRCREAKLPHNLMSNTLKVFFQALRPLIYCIERPVTDGRYLIMRVSLLERAPLLLSWLLLMDASLVDILQYLGQSETMMSVWMTLQRSFSLLIWKLILRLKTPNAVFREGTEM